MTIKWPAADFSLPHSPSLSLPLSLSPFLCTLMYKIAPIHKQHHYFHCLPTVLSLFLLFLSPSPLSLSHTQTHTHKHTHLTILSKTTLKVYFALGALCGHG